MTIMNLLYNVKIKIWKHYIINLSLCISILVTAALMNVLTKLKKVFLIMIRYLLVFVITASFYIVKKHELWYQYLKNAAVDNLLIAITI